MPEDLTYPLSDPLAYLDEVPESLFPVSTSGLVRHMCASGRVDNDIANHFAELVAEREWQSKAELLDAARRINWTTTMDEAANEMSETRSMGGIETHTARTG
jgi:hypothetical protein